MKRIFAPIITLLVSLLLLFIPCSLVPLTTQAAELNNGISLLQIDQNASGAGYSWDNINRVLTLDGIDLVTADDYGFKIPANATVIIKGKNRIEATKAAIYIQGDVRFRGSGSLTLSGEYGFLCNGTNTSQKVTFSEGTYRFSGTKVAIKSDAQKVYLGGGNFTLDGDEVAIDAREIITGGNVSVDAVGSFSASYAMTLEAADLSILSTQAALITPKLTIANMTLRVGESEGALTKVDSYNGEKCLVTKSTFDDSAKSFLFGESVPFFVDVLVLIAFLILLVSAVLVPLLLKKKRAKIAIAARDTAAAEREAQRKAEKKAAKKKS